VNGSTTFDLQSEAFGQVLQELLWPADGEFMPGQELLGILL
jgi:hypothetical protein